MAKLQSIRFIFFKITTDEFAITEEDYDPAVQGEVKLNLAFNFSKEEKAIKVQAKSMFYQHEKLLIVITVSSIFKIEPADWESIYSAEDRTYSLSRPPALHLASLTVGAARGVLHAKTENLALNAVILPPINLHEILKEDIVIPVQD